MSRGLLQSWTGSDPRGPDAAGVLSLTDPGHCDLIVSLLDENDLASLGSSSSLTAQPRDRCCLGKPQMVLLAPRLLMSRAWITFSDARSACVRKLSPQLPVCSRPGAPAALKLCPDVFFPRCHGCLSFSSHFSVLSGFLLKTCCNSLAVICARRCHVRLNY